MFHTQEKRPKKLDAPCPTNNPQAWFGTGWYFWYYEADAIFWGLTAKRKTGFYEVYKVWVNCENILDTVFNEEHYNFWIKHIEKAVKSYVIKGKTVNLKDINDYFKANGIFDDIDGFMFQDITNNPDYYFVKEFQYKKRIQLAVYNLEIVNNFEFFFESECS